MANTISSKAFTDASDPSALSTPLYITQINAGNTLYDVATHHSIIFHDGASDSTGFAWNGVQDIDVYIPSIADIVSDPVYFAGTVEDSTSVYNSWTSTDHSGDKGALVYITKDCTFATIACEAGDMAVWDGTKWCVVSGENQVTIVAGTGAPSDNNTTVTLTSAAKEVLSVEGKHLSLNVDYTGVKDVLSVAKNSDNTLNVVGGNVTVASMTVGLKQGEDSTKTVGSEVSIALPTALASEAVTISDKVFQASDFSFVSGALPTPSKNTTGIACSMSVNITLASNTDGTDYVRGFDSTPLKSVTLTSNSGDNALSFVKSAATTTTSTQTFVSAIHAASTEAEKEAGKGDFRTVSSIALTGITTFASQFGAETSTKGDDSVLSSINVGAVTFDSSKKEVLTGISGDNTNGVIVTGVSFGGLTTNNSQWFVSGLGAEQDTTSDVLSSVTVGDVTLRSDSSSSFASSAVATASVSGHVLTFTIGSYMAPVSISQAATTFKYKPFTKSGVALTGQSVNKAVFTTGGYAQADTTVSYKSLVTGTVGVSYNTTNYFLDTKNETVPTYETGYASISTTNVSVSTGGYSLTNKSVTATVPTGTVLVDFASAGTLPTLTINDPSRTISGTVGTSLTTTSVSWLGVATAASTITIPGAYTLSSDSDATTPITVATAGTYDMNTNSATVTIAAETYVTDVKVSGTAVTVESNTSASSAV